MNQGHRALLFVFLIFSSPPVFSKEEKSKTEAGAPCLDQNCPSIEGSLQTLQETTSDQMCKATQSKPECKGIKKDHLKGCASSRGALSAVPDGALACTMGVFKGIAELLTSVAKGIKSIFSDDEDPGMKAYLHAEYESAYEGARLESRYGSGKITAPLSAVKSLFELLYSSMGDVYSCLNSVGLSQKMCAFFSTGVLATAGLGASVSLPLAGLAAAGAAGLGPAALAASGIALAFIIFHNDPFSAVVGASFFGAAGSALGELFAPVYLLAALAAKPAAVVGGVIGATAGSAALHDEQVKKRIMEKMKIKIRELETEIEEKEYLNMMKFKRFRLSEEDKRLMRKYQIDKFN